MHTVDPFALDAGNGWSAGDPKRPGLRSARRPDVRRPAASSTVRSRDAPVRSRSRRVHASRPGRRCRPGRRPGTSLGWSTTHHRQSPLEHQLQVGVVVGGRVDDETVHARPTAPRWSLRRQLRPGPTATSSRPCPASSQDLGEAGDEVQRGGIAERIGQRFGDDQADRTGLAGAQRSRHRIGAGIAQPLGGGEDPLTQIGRQLIRAVVGIGDRGARDLELSGQRSQRGPYAAAQDFWTCSVRLADRRPDIGRHRAMRRRRCLAVGAGALGYQPHHQPDHAHDRDDHEARRHVEHRRQRQGPPRPTRSTAPSTRPSPVPGRAVSMIAVAAGVTTRANSSRVPTAWTAIVTARPSSAMKITDSTRTGTPLASATSALTDANSSGR